MGAELTPSEEGRPRAITAIATLAERDGYAFTTYN